MNCRDHERPVPVAIADVIPGVRFNVYQAQDGRWHAHVTGLRFGDLDGLMMRSTSVTAEGIAHRIVEKAAESGESIADVLFSYASRYRVTANGNGEWCDVGYCGSEGEARERACAVIGHVFGRRLVARVGPYTPPTPATFPGIREMEFSR